jgi:formylglycine-generating enzyme required for sulfatase activity
MSIQEYFRILGLAHGASLQEIRQAYRDLVKVWHPDRFQNDLRLQGLVQEKLKEINIAYEIILQNYAPRSAQTMKSSHFHTEAYPPESKPPDSALSLALVSIPSGTFGMGSADGDEDERPVHAVTLRAFSMGAHTVTQEQFKAVMGYNPSRFTGEKNLPVEQVNWFDAVRFCNLLSDAWGLNRCYNESAWECDFSKNGFRLPSEAEWEYACRAGTKTSYYSGDRESDLDPAGWYKGNSGGETRPVGQKAPNARGLYDMHGNVWEWCNDWYGSYSGHIHPSHPSSQTGPFKVKRGGGWYFDAECCRSSYRGNFEPDFRDCLMGFRVVRRG